MPYDHIFSILVSLSYSNRALYIACDMKCYLDHFNKCTVYCFLFAVKKFHVFRGLLGNRETFFGEFLFLNIALYKY